MKRSMILLLSLMIFTAYAWAGSCAMGDDKTASGPKCGDSCPAHGKEIVKTDKDVALSGTIRCMHCDLHKSDHCQKVLVTADKKIYQICPDSLKGVDLETLSGKKVEIKGSVMTLKTGDPVIHADTFKVV